MKKLLSTLTFFLFATYLRAVSPVPLTESLGFSSIITDATPGSPLSSGGGSVQISGEGGGSSSGGNLNAAESAISSVLLKPGKSYVLNFTGSLQAPSAGPNRKALYTINFVSPVGYGVFVDGVRKERVSIEFSGTGTSISLVNSSHVVEIRPIGNTAPAMLGSFSGIQLGRSIYWDVGLGSLRAGQSAGRISFREDDLTNSPASRARLNFPTTTENPQVKAYWTGGSGDRLKQVAIDQVAVVNVEDEATGGYSFKFYRFSDMSGSQANGYTPTDPNSFWKKITVTSPAANQLVVAEVEGGVTRQSTLVLDSGTVGIAAYRWKLTEGNASTVLRTTTHQFSAVASGVREDVVSTYTGNVSTGTPAARTKYEYTAQNWGVDEVTAVVVDPDTAVLRTTYNYFTVATDKGNYRKLQSVVEPSGRWTSYLYYDDVDRRGLLSVESHPFMDSPATYVGASIAVGESISYTYAPDFTGRYGNELDRVFQTKVGAGASVQTGHRATTTALSGSGNTRYGQTFTTFTTKEYADSGTGFQQTITEIADPATANGDYNNKLYSVKRPDGSQDSYAYFRVTDAASGYAESASGTFFRTNVWHGRKIVEGETPFSTYGAAPATAVTAIYLIPNKSTMDVTIQNPAGLVVRKETYVYTGGANFSLIAWENFTYDVAGRQITWQNSKGATVENAIVGGRLTATIDADGILTSYGYDELGRIKTVTKDGVTLAAPYASQQPLVTTYTYDGANNIIQTETKGTNGSSTLTITASAEYDLAGRKKNQIQNLGSANQLTTTYGYSNSNRKVTISMPQGTQTSEVYLDGQLKQVGGSSAVAQDYTFGVDASGRKFAQSTFGGFTAGTTTTYTDWLGRKVQETKPAWNSGTATSTWFYNTFGQLYKFSQPGVSDTLYVYDSLGTLLREGMDLGGAAGSLDDSSTDRIVAHTWAIEAGTGGSWWLRRTDSVFTTPGTATTHVVSDVSEQLYGLAAGRRAYRKTTDNFGNVTTSTVDVDRANKVVTTTTDVPDSPLSVVQKVVNGLLLETTDSVGVQVVYGYDLLGRSVSVKDPRTGTALTAYRAGTNLIDYVKDSLNVTQASYTYDSAGRVATVTNTLSKVARYEYNERNQKVREWGDTVTPTEYVYDSLGRQKQMKTYRGGTGWNGPVWPVATAGTPDWTLWVYDAATGLLKEKYDAGNLDAVGAPIAGAKKTSYTYTAAGQLYTREWARSLPSNPSLRVMATYSYFPTGELNNIAYNDGTATVSYTYNRLGAVQTVADVTGDRTFDYATAGTLELKSETLSAGLYEGRRLGYYYDAAGSGTNGRLTVFGLGSGADVPSGAYSAYQFQNYDYYSDGRLKYSGVYANNFTANVRHFTFSYQSLSRLPRQVSESTSLYSDTRVYDANHDWVDQRGTTVGGVAKAVFDYTQDAMGRIQDIRKSGELYARFGSSGEGLTTSHTYNDRSELESENHKVGASGLPLTGRDNWFSYDNSGNRKNATHLSNTPAFNTAYTVNSNNQYTARSAPALVEVAGAASSNTATVVTNGVSPSRSGKYFYGAFLLSGATGGRQVESVYGVTPQVKSLDGICHYNWQNQPMSFQSVAGPTTGTVSALELGGSPWHALIEGYLINYTFQNGRTYKFGFWARTVTAGTSRTITPGLTDDGNAGLVSATFTIDNGWKWVTVTKTYSSAGAYPRLFYTWDGGGVPFQVYGAQIADVTDSQYAGSVASYLPPTPETFSYDDDGNLTGDGHSTYLYDAENRLIWVQTAPTAVNAGEPLVAFRYYYDYLGRRVIKLDYTWNGTSWVQGAYDVHVYRGWNLIHTKSVSAANVTTLKNYFWGLDLSGTEQGAGGVGGLLVVQEGNNSYLPMYDAMGNVHGMITAASATFGGTTYPAGSIVAEYEYDGFGKTVRESGPYAASNRIRYSTKYTDAESGLVYYGMRHYSPSLGRFINRDPLGEAGGLNLYGFCGNSGVNRWDYLGMDADSEAAEARARTIAESIRARYQHYNSGNGSNFGNFFISLDGMEPWIKFSDPSHTISYVVGGVTYTVTNDPNSVPSGANAIFHGTAAQAASNAAAAAADLELYKAGIIASALGTFGGSGGSNSEILAPNSTGIDPSGKGDIGTYLVRKNAAGEWVIVGKTNGVTTANAYVNGILGTLGRHAELGGKHMPAGVTEFTLFNNPSKGFFADIWETSMDKLGFTSAPARALAGVLQGVQSYGSNVSWVAHSQGGAIFAEAMSYAGGSLSHNSVTFNAGANNHWVTNSIAASAGVQVNGYYYSSWDAVPNVIGANGNPLSMLGSVLAAPLLFTDNHSPHTAPTSGWRKRF